MTVAPDLLRIAGAALGVRLGRQVRLVGAIQLESDSVVFRARVAGSDSLPSVIVKQVKNTEFDHADHVGPPSRFLNEWAALDFLTDAGATVAPRLLAAEREAGLIVIEDLGELATVEHLLFADDPVAARTGLREMGHVLGRLHASGFRREKSFGDAQRRVGAMSPTSDSTMDLRDRLPLLEVVAGEMAAPTQGFGEDVAAIEAIVHDESESRTLIHADAGPHNVLVGGDSSRLIDFEFATYRSAMCDLAGARLGFPQTMGPGRVPRDVIAELEDSYRGAIAGLPFGDPAWYEPHLVAAAGHWALNRWAAVWRDVVQRCLAEDLEPNARAAMSVSHCLGVMDGFVGTAKEMGAFPAAAAAIEHFASAVREQWPALEAPPVYPAFRTGSTPPSSG